MSASNSSMDVIKPLTFEDFDWLLNTPSESIENWYECFYPSTRTTRLFESSQVQPPVARVESEKPIFYWDHLMVDTNPADDSDEGFNSASSAPSSSTPSPISSATIRIHESGQTRFCYFCKTGANVASRHTLYTKEGRVGCPELRKIVCPHCGATGDDAHTAQWCPKLLVRTKTDEMAAILEINDNVTCQNQINTTSESLEEIGATVKYPMAAMTENVQKSKLCSFTSSKNKKTKFVKPVINVTTSERLGGRDLCLTDFLR